MVWFLSLTGLRWGEMVALKRTDVDLMRRRVSVHVSATEVHGRLVFGTPKSHKARTVVMPKFLQDLLVIHTAGVHADELLFSSPKGGYLRNSNFRLSVWKPALRSSGLDESLRIHDLRATAASLAVSAGGSIKAVQRMLGHASAKMTLDTYAGLFEEDLEILADRLNDRILQAYVAPALPLPISSAHLLELQHSDLGLLKWVPGESNPEPSG